MSDQKPVEEGGPNPVLTLLKAHGVTIAIVVLAIIFIAQNTNDVRLKLLWVSFTAPQWLTLAIVALIGLIVGWMLKRRSVRRAQ